MVQLTQICRDARTSYDTLKRHTGFDKRDLVLRATPQHIFRIVELGLGKPSRIRRWQGGTVHDQTSFLTYHVGVVPYFAPEFVNVINGPFIEIGIRRECQGMLGIDTPEKLKHSGLLWGRWGIEFRRVRSDRGIGHQREF